MKRPPTLPIARLAAALAVTLPLSAGTLPAAADEPGRTGPDNAITDVPGIQVGHYTDRENITGTTALVIPKGATAGSDARGGAPGTINTDVLDPVALEPTVHGLLLSGGSVMGLSAYSGVVQYLREQGLGMQFGGKPVPVVPGAIVFDLGQGADADDRIEKTPGFDAGYRAAKAAKPGRVEMGSVGAGTGTGTGGPPGIRLKGGVGTASIQLGDGLVVGALVVLNSAGKVYNEAAGCELYTLYMEVGNEFGGTRRPPRGCKTATSTPQHAPRSGPTDPHLDENTTIGVVATNAKLTVAQAEKLAQVAHDGLARAIRPAHTMGDGDTTFGLSTRTAAAPDGAAFGALLDAAASTFSRATVHAALAATPLGGRQPYCQVFAGACDRRHTPATNGSGASQPLAFRPASGTSIPPSATTSGYAALITIPALIGAGTWTLRRRRRAGLARR
ncbi:P1 family peptidase [Actinomadura sp. 3N508]|uniref:P1 family peptidase n=1 Tax=Actinomadura sp. 3N508 TaxID=3375153 RepID=UPI0037B6793F